MLYLTTQLRADRGLPPYQSDSRLKASAEKYAEYAFKYGDPNNGSHELYLNPTLRAAEEGYTGLVWENMDAGYDTADQTFDEFVHSSGHLANFLLSVPDIGVACYQGPRNINGFVYTMVECVMDFGKPPEPLPIPTSTPYPIPTRTPTPTPAPTSTPTPTAAPTPTP